MISALLLPFFAFGDPGAARAAVQDDPPIQLWISNDRQFFPGERVKVQVRTEADGYLLVLHVDPDGYLRVLFPLDPDKDSFVRGGKKYEVRGRGDRQAFEADGKGRGTVYAAVSREPFRFDNFVLGDHWDYNALAPSRLSSNPESELNELVRRMAQGDFDYDILSYDVVERAAYATNHYHHYYYDDDPWCYRLSCRRYYYGSPYSISIFFGRPYRRYYYDPYFYAYDPFYNPFFYDPYYYAPVYYPRYVHPWRYYSPGYWDWYRYRYHYYNRPYTPYRFRRDDFNGGYRDRRYDGRSVNTVYHPPIGANRAPAIAGPVRRVIGSPETPAAELPSRVAPRRVADDARRVIGRPVEARRARADVTGRERSAGEPRLIRRETEARPSREVRPSRSDERRAEPPRSTQPAPRREAPSRGEARGGGGGHQERGGSRPSDEGGRRRR
jgi:hypothetical protein